MIFFFENYPFKNNIFISVAVFPVELFLCDIQHLHNQMCWQYGAN